MTDRHRLVTRSAAAVALSIALLGCAGPLVSPGGASEPAATARSTDMPSGVATMSPGGAPTSTASALTSAAPAIVLDRPWATAQLVDVSTGGPFRIADHAGKVIVIETMAIWCTNCRRQQGDVQAALRRLPSGSVVYVVLDTEPSENGQSLAAYRERNGFEGRYAIAGAQVARALAAEFGDQVLNPPSTPMILVGVDGRVTLTDFGHKSPDEIVALAESHGA
jgi:hypothetical protein